MDLKSESLTCSSRDHINGLLTEMNNQKIIVPDHHHHQMKGLNYYENGGNKSDNFIVDLNGFSNGGIDELPTTNSTTINTNSRITWLRSFSRKGPQRDVERKINGRDPSAPSSPKVIQVVTIPEKSIFPSSLIGSLDPFVNNHQLPHHQITIKTGDISPVAEGRWRKRSSFKRSAPSWFSNPKSILLLFATLSSMGTILLIYFTLSMSKFNEKEGVLDW